MANVHYQTWDNWCDTSSSYTVTTSTADSTWNYWCDTSTTATTTGAVWVEWVSGDATVITDIKVTTGVAGTAWAKWVDIREETLEQRNQREIERRQAVEAEEQRLREIKEAEETALKLLKDNLTKKQLEAFEKDQCIPVDTAKGNKYLIQKKGTPNIVVLDKEGKRSHRLCVHPREQVPIYDTLLAQKLFLELAEEELLAIANRHGL